MENIEPKTEYHLKGIELIRCTINTPEGVPAPNFIFSINLQTRLDAVSKTLTVIVNVDVISDDQKTVFGSISVNNIYQIINFEEAFKLNAQNQYEIPPKLGEAIGSTSLSTARGIMFFLFKGTFLNNALLPLIDPQRLKQQ
ncbi:MAG TPA: hypothetical protein VGS79_18210 [Puia sp.]|nr:hypothetical protein [Puia sp.]